MKPELVIQVAFQDWTVDGILRQPRYLGMREDRDPKTVTREEPEHTEDVVKKETRRESAAKVAAKAARAKRPTAGAGRPAQRLTHPDRVLYPQDGITKLQLAEYFAAVGEAAMPHYANRPLRILRNTHGAQPFFQKHFLEKSGAGLEVVKIPNADKDPDFVVCDSTEGLLHLAQVGAVELHSWGAVMPKPTHADRLTFDLDPGAGLPYAQLRDAALAIRKLLQEHGLESLGQDHRRQGPARRRAADEAAARLGSRQGIRAQRHAVHGEARADDVHVQDRRAEPQEQDLRRLPAQRLRRHGRRRVLAALAPRRRRLDAGELG